MMEMVYTACSASSAHGGRRGMNQGGFISSATSGVYHLHHNVFDSLNYIT